MNQKIQPEENKDDWMEEYEGQLALDVFQDSDNVVVKAPIAGVKPSDLEIAITDEVVTIKGARKEDDTIQKDSYFCQECYWGAFSRSYVLPVAVDADKAKAKLEEGILCITIPKLEKSKTRVLKVNSE